jgi:radical SAM-linked protein
MKLRIEFKKQGALRFCSHKDIVRNFQRCFLACEVPIAFSEGYHPHMKMSFGPPAKTGWASDGEYMDIVVTELVGADFVRRCNEHLPEGLAITGVRSVPDRCAKLVQEMAAARMEILVRKEDAFGPDPISPEQIDGLKQSIETDFAGKGADNVPVVLDVEVRTSGDWIGISYMSTMLSGKIVAPTEVVESSIGDPSAFRIPMSVSRKAQYVERDGEFMSPIAKGVF